MDNIETVNTYQFTRPGGGRVNVTVVYDNDKKCVTHKYDAEDIGDAYMPAQWWKEALEMKPYHKLHKENRILYDFLKARIGE